RHVGPLSGLAAVDEPGCACIRSQEHRAVRVAGEERVQHHLVARSEDAQFRHHAATILIARFLVTRFPRTIPPAPMRRLNAAIAVSRCCRRTEAGSCACCATAFPRRTTRPTPGRSLPSTQRGGSLTWRRVRALETSPRGRAPWCSRPRRR